ncbi:MAG: hydroxyethylthiazole kinase [Clostridiales bacterium]|nr:hydroxyethylthiazole kinase [Clostridiales bacterium]
MEFEFLKRTALTERSRLIHCITNPISINDCANLILAMGAQPMMAEHPAETERITGMADALALNLGNITDVRMESMRISAACAHARGIPSVLDCVGIGASRLRLNYAGSLIRDFGPSVIKGNLSEWKVLCGLEERTRGVDLTEADRLTRVTDCLDEFARFAREHRVVALVSGAEDLVTDGTRAVLVANGHPMMSRITGTGCMLGAMTATWLAVAAPFAAAVQACVTFGLAGEIAAGRSRGPGSFRTELLDALYNLTDEALRQNAQIMEIGSIPNRTGAAADRAGYGDANSL